MSGLFITFEGLDGSGKSSHLRRAARWLARRGVRVEATREPGGTPLGAAIRRLFLRGGWGTPDGLVEALLVFASRRQHLLERIEPALAAGRHVLCDRFTDSTLAYQGFGRGVPLAALAALDALATGSRRPDRTLFFAAGLAEARRRGGDPDRGGPSGAANRLDIEDLAFYGRVEAGYRELVRREPGRFVHVDSTGTPAATARQVREALADLLPAAEAARRGRRG